MKQPVSKPKSNHIYFVYYLTDEPSVVVWAPSISFWYAFLFHLLFYSLMLILFWQWWQPPPSSYECAGMCIGLNDGIYVYINIYIYLISWHFTIRLCISMGTMMTTANGHHHHFLIWLSSYDSLNEWQDYKWLIFNEMQEVGLRTICIMCTAIIFTAHIG